MGEDADDETRCLYETKYWDLSFKYSFLCQSFLQATIAASRQASSPNASTPQQTTTTQASVSYHISKPFSAPYSPLPLFFLLFVF